jgi:hypothetical protein
MNGIPDGLIVDVVITMPKNISHATETYPVWAWTEDFSIVAQPYGSFGNDLQFALDSGFRLTVCYILRKADSVDKRLCMSDAVSYVSRWCRAVLEGKDGLFGNLFTKVLSQAL